MQIVVWVEAGECPHQNLATVTLNWFLDYSFQPLGLPVPARGEASILFKVGRSLFGCNNLKQPLAGPVTVQWYSGSAPALSAKAACLLEGGVNEDEGITMAAPASALAAPSPQWQ